MKSGRLTIWLIGLVFLVSGIRGYSGTYFNDGHTHVIDYAIEDDVYIDSGEAFAEIGTRVSVVEGGYIGPSAPYSFYACNQSRVAISGGLVDYLFALDTSTVTISGGTVRGLETYNSSVVSITGGTVEGIVSFDKSTVNISKPLPYARSEEASTVNIISGGHISEFNANGSSTVNILDGTISFLTGFGSSKVNLLSGTVVNLYGTNASISGGRIAYLGVVDATISGGQIDVLQPSGFGTITFLAQDFLLGEGLSLIGERLVGTGMLYCKWLDGTEWGTFIDDHADTVNILLIPEPCTLLLLGVGGMLIRKG